MAKDLSALDAAGSALYDAGFADGVVSVSGATFTQAQVDAAVAAGKADQKAADIAAFQALVDPEAADLKAKAAAI